MLFRNDILQYKYMLFLTLFYLKPFILQVALTIVINCLIILRARLAGKI